MNNLNKAKHALNKTPIWKAKYYKRRPMTFGIELQNLGTVNKNVVTMTINENSLELWFSYKTIVAFRKNNKLYCIQNQWGPTTGKLLNNICPNKKERLTEPKFAEELNNILTI